MQREDPDVTLVKLYFPDDPQIKVHKHVHHHFHKASTGIGLMGPKPTVRDFKSLRFGQDSRSLKKISRL